MHVLGHEYNSVIFFRKGQNNVEKSAKKLQKHTKNGEIFYHFRKGNSHTCNYYMHEMSKICPGLCKMHQLHIIPYLCFVHPFYARLIFFRVKYFSKITSHHTSLFQNF